MFLSTLDLLYHTEHYIGHYVDISDVNIRFLQICRVFAPNKLLYNIADHRLNLVFKEE